MSKMKKTIAAVLAAGMLLAPTTAMEETKADSTKLENLRVNYVSEPVGIDDIPKFSWEMNSDIKGQKQNSYKIEVSKDKAFSEIVWDSGTVNDPHSIDIEYTGEKLSPSTKYYWRVTVKDKDQKDIISDTASFETGLMDENAWNDAHWLMVPSGSAGEVNYTVECKATLINDALGIVFSGKDSNNFYMWQLNAKDGNGKLLLRPHIWTDGNVTTQDIDISSFFTVSDILNNEVDFKIEVSDGFIKTYINETLVSTYTDSSAILGDIGFRACTDQNTIEKGAVDDFVLTDYSGGFADIVAEFDFNNGENPFDSGENPFDSGEVKGGKLYTEQATGTAVSMTGVGGQGISMYRKSFTPEKEIKSVKLYSTALGIYEIYLNGERIGRKYGGKTVYDELKPGWTDYRDRALYYTYDITDWIADGENVLTAEVSPGWASGRIAAGTYGNLPTSFIAKILINYSDGTNSVINTDNTWKASQNTAVKSADIWDGETYDARSENDALKKPGYNDSEMTNADYFTEFKGVISANPGNTVRVKENLQITSKQGTVYEGSTNNGTDYGEINVINENAVLPIELKAGQTVIFDMEQNMVGRPVITLNADEGAKLTIRFAEMLNDTGAANRGNDGPKGSLYTANYRSAKSTAVYIAKGGQDETYRALHTFFGYRYLSITASKDITIKRLFSEVIGSDNQETGTITTSDASVNQLISNIMWGQRGNYLSTATDCPQRDERLGWTGDTGFFVGAASYNADVASFFTKWMTDCVDAQHADGAYTDIVPESYVSSAGNVAWGDAGIIVPHTMYKMYGDTTIIRTHYDSMKKYRELLRRNNGYPSNTYGDWLSYENTDKNLIAKAYYYYMTSLMIDIAEALDESVDLSIYSERLDYIKNSFVNSYFLSNGQPKTNARSQTALLLILKLNLFPNSDAEENCKQLLRNKIVSNGNKLSTGFVGTATIAQTLGDEDMSDLAYTLLLQRDNPSWLYSVDQGATTIWERWNSYTLASGFGDVSMNSFNHYSFGAVVEWMYNGMAGIKPDLTDPGFKKFVLAPTPDKRNPEEIPDNQNIITSADASFKCSYGMIKSAWDTSDGVFSYQATVPANTTATLKFPTMGVNMTSVYIDGTEIELENLAEGTEISDGVVYLGKEGKTTLFSLDSGSYEFRQGDDKPIPITGVSLSSSSLTLKPGETASLTATVSPADTTDDYSIEWSSSNNSVAQVDTKGNIQAIDSGEAIITAKTGDFSAECKVTVTLGIDIDEPDNNNNSNNNGNNIDGTPTDGIKDGVLYVNGKAVTGNTVQKVGSVTYAVVNGKIAVGSRTRVVTIGSSKYIVDKNGVVTTPKKRSIKTVSGKSYVVGTNGRIMLSKKQNKLYKVGTRSYVVKKRTGVIIKSKKKNMLAKAGNKWYVVKKRTGAVIKGKKAMTAKAGKKTYVLKKRTGLVMRSTKKALKATVKGKRYTIAKRTGAARLAG